MKAQLSAIHLLQQLVFFLLVSLSVLTMIRCAYVLWQFSVISKAGVLFQVLLTGLRIDLALIGMILLPVLLLGGILGMGRRARKWAKPMVAALLMLGTIFILLTELITPYFLVEQGIRPDFRALKTIDDPAEMFKTLWLNNVLPVSIGIILALLIIATYWVRLDYKSLLRLPLKPLPTLTLIGLGVPLCLLAIYSGTDFSGIPLPVTASLISTETIVNEITLNSGFKLLKLFIASFV